MARIILIFLLALLLNGAATRAGAQDLYAGAAPTWLDEYSRPLSLRSLRGRSVVLTLAYGACRRVCSTSIRIMERLQALADVQGVALDFVVVGLDPSQDKPADWADFRAQRKNSRNNWHFLSGDPAAIRALTQRLGVNVWRIDSYWMHDFKIVLLSPQGLVLRTMDRFDQTLETLLP
jgi:protein SCO1/2